MPSDVYKRQRFDRVTVTFGRCDVPHPAGHTEVTEQPRLTVELQPPILAFPSDRRHFRTDDGGSYDLARNAFEHDVVLHDLGFADAFAEQCALDHAADGFDLRQLWHIEIVARAAGTLPASLFSSSLGLLLGAFVCGLRWCDDRTCLHGFRC